MSVSDP
jgi:hypothetical protein